MRAWERARAGERCGNCDRQQADGTPVLVIEIPHVKAEGRRRMRCQDCAGEPVDLDQLEAFDIRAECASSTPATPYEFRGVTKPLPFDAKAAAAGDNSDV